MKLLLIRLWIVDLRELTEQDEKVSLNDLIDFALRVLSAMVLPI